MPVNKKKDKIGKYYQYGKTGKKYYYKTERGEKISRTKANKQMKAIEISKRK